MSALMTTPRVLRIGAVSTRWSPRTAATTLGAAIIAAALCIVSLGIGDLALPPGRVLEVLSGGGTRQEQLVVITLRLTRAMLGLLVGAMLAVSGAIVQTTTRNGLASPDLLGITSGAGAAAVAVIILGGSSTSATGATSLLHALNTSGAALVGGLTAAITVAAILRMTSGGRLQMLLVGVGTSALFSGLTSWMLIAASIEDAEKANAWLAGSLNGRGTEEVVMAALTLSIIAIVLVPLSTRIPALNLGTDMAIALGQNAQRSRGALLLCAIMLASISSAVAGPIGFVALVAPHIAQRAAGSPRPPLLASAMIGSAIVTASDLLARTLAAPILLPTGAVTAIIGAPFLIWLLVRQGKDTIR